MGRPPSERNQRIAAAIPDLRSAENYHNWQQIADKFGVSRNVVMGVAMRLGYYKDSQAERESPKRREARKRFHQPQALSNTEPTLIREPAAPRRFSWEKKR